MMILGWQAFAKCSHNLESARLAAINTRMEANFVRLEQGIELFFRRFAKVLGTLVIRHDLSEEIARLEMLVRVAVYILPRWP
jgi:hypothetical protein